MLEEFFVEKHFLILSARTVMAYCYIPRFLIFKHLFDAKSKGLCFFKNWNCGITLNYNDGI